MELSQEFLIDVAINASGYLLAAALGMVMYSLFFRRKEAASVATPAVAPEVAPVPPPASRETGKVEFIRLGESTAAEPTSAARANRFMVQADNGRRNRSDVMDIARRMLDAGASPERIKRVLPVSDVELSLLSMNNS